LNSAQEVEAAIEMKLAAGLYGSHGGRWQGCRQPG
jgi:hypothetical protein